jgi:hypothetical protein
MSSRQNRLLFIRSLNLELKEELQNLGDAVDAFVASPIFEQVTKNLVESVLVSDENWIFLSQLEAYIPRHRLDNCARSERPFVYYDQPASSVQSPP